MCLKFRQLCCFRSVLFFPPCGSHLPIVCECLFLTVIAALIWYWTNVPQGTMLFIMIVDICDGRGAFHAAAKVTSAAGVSVSMPLTLVVMKQTVTRAYEVLVPSARAAD